MRHKVTVNPEVVAEADKYFGAYVRDLSPTKQKIAKHTRDLVKKGIYPSGKKVAEKMGRRGFDQSENGVRYTVYHAYGGTEGIIQGWRKKFSRARVDTGLMFKKEIMK